MATRDEIVAEIRRVETDLYVFKHSRDVIQNHINDIEAEPERHEQFVSWAATQVIMNGLIMAIVRCEGLIEDYRKVLDGMDISGHTVH